MTKQWRWPVATLCMFLISCSGSGSESGTVTTTTLGTSVSKPSSLGADGWATYYAGGSGVTKGGADADATHTYTVRNRNELIMVVYPDAVIATDGSYFSAKGADNTPKVIYVQGTINLSMNKALVELKEADYKDPAYDFNAYVAAYKPSVWNVQALVNGKPPQVAGALETARIRSSDNQGKVDKVALGSNTSLLGLGSDAKIIKGHLSVGSGVDNVVIRNITFEDAFDYFAAWDPTDSYVVDTAQAGCQTTYLNASVGPQKCPGGHWNSNYDNVNVSGGTHVWIDHCNFSDGDREDWTFPSLFEAPHTSLDYVIEHHDGAVDITSQSNFVTVSNNHFKNHDKTILLGGSDSATVANGWGALSVTLHHNWYENTGQRMPRVRLGKVHVYNNYYTGQIGYYGQYAPIDGTPIPNNRFLYGIGIGYLAKIYSEQNVFEIQDAPVGNPLKVNDQVTIYTWHKAAPATGTGLDVGQETYFYDKGTQLNGKAVNMMAAAQTLAASLSKPPLLSTDTVWTPASNYSYTADSATTVKASVLANAGAGKL